MTGVRSFGGSRSPTRRPRPPGPRDRSGLEEGEGTLAAIADLQEQIAALEQGGEDSEEEDSESGVLLGGIGIGLGAIALLVSLLKKK